MTTVLVVDDEPIVREIAVRYLERAGYVTREAGDGRTARAARAGTTRPRRARRHAAGSRRTGALPLDPRALRAARDHADGAWRGSRPHRGPRARRRRLHHEAVLTAGARGASSYRAATYGPDRSHRGATLLRRCGARLRHAGRAEGRSRSATDSEGVRSAVVSGLPSAARVRTRPADEPCLGLRGGARHGHDHRPRPAAGEKLEDDPSRPVHLQTVWGVGYRLVP